jgi:hypothetical protein
MERTKGIMVGDEKVKSDGVDSDSDDDDNDLMRMMMGGSGGDSDDDSETENERNNSRAPRASSSRRSRARVLVGHQYVRQGVFARACARTLACARSRARDKRGGIRRW